MWYILLLSMTIFHQKSNECKFLLLCFILSVYFKTYCHSKPIKMAKNDRKIINFTSLVLKFRVIYGECDILENLAIILLA